MLTPWPCVCDCVLRSEAGSAVHDRAFVCARRRAGNPNTSVFDECLDKAACSLSGLTLLRTSVTPTGDVVDMYSTPCPEGHYGPLCFVRAHASKHRPNAGAACLC